MSSEEEKDLLKENASSEPCAHSHVLDDKTTEDDLMALDRFMTCKEENYSASRSSNAFSKPTDIHEEEDDTERQKRFFQQQVAKLKGTKVNNESNPPIDFGMLETDGHSLISMIKAKFQASEQGQEVIDAWSKDYQLSNANNGDKVEQAEHSGPNEGDLLVDELLDDEEILDKTKEELERSTTPYSWRFDEPDLCAALDLKVDNFVEENDDFDFNSAYIPTSLVKQQESASKTQNDNSQSGLAEAMEALLTIADAEDQPPMEDIETLEFEGFSDDDEEDNTTANYEYSLQEMIAMVGMIGGNHERERMQSIAMALRHGHSAEVDNDYNSGEVRSFTDVEEFEIVEEEVIVSSKVISSEMP